MTYDETLAKRVRKILAMHPDVVEQKMFGGLAFLLRGKMFVGVIHHDLMVRVGPESYTAALKRPHVRPMDFTGRPLTGFVYVAAPGWRTDAAVERWARQAAEFVATLPATKRKPRRPRPRGARKPR
ncbi:MAG: TfoX/Sxy family protein [Myxococcales bacterium]|nr:TfoX/Sxy family protein [Myxococcales bacterium]